LNASNNYIFYMIFDVTGPFMTIGLTMTGFNFAVTGSNSRLFLTGLPTNFLTKIPSKKQEDNRIELLEEKLQDLADQMLRSSMNDPSYGKKEKALKTPPRTPIHELTGAILRN